MRLFGRRRRRWSIVTAAPRGPAGEQWGDTWFARDLVDALRRAGEEAKVVPRQGAESEKRDGDDVVLVLRGLTRVTPRPNDATWLLWVISHPELVDEQEAAQFAAVFAASEHWRPPFDVIPLLQATNPARFSPDAAAPDSGERVLFVGSTRGEYRPIVRDALACGVEVSVFGVGWEAYLDPARIKGDFLPNEVLPAAYAGAGIVLNDHWRPMAEDGFLSNRLFDATATATRVVSDEATGLREVFGDVVRTYRDGDGLCTLLSDPAQFADRDARLDLAATVAREHSFDARARTLIECVERLR